MFFRENDSDRRRIDYGSAVPDNFRLVPSGTVQEALAEDYASMLSIGMLLAANEPLGALMQGRARIEERADTESGDSRHRLVVLARHRLVSLPLASHLYQDALC